MPLLHLKDVSLSLGQPLLTGVNLAIERGERLCLTGRNGAGKSTLLRVLTGAQPPDEGEVIHAPELKMAQLAQEVPQDLAGSVFHVVAGGLGAAGQLIERYHHLAQSLADASPAALAPLAACEQAIEAAGGWNLNQRVDTVISRLRLEPDAAFEQLSGGLKRRVLLARALAAEPDLLLLDEPTNHLDIAAITWLEEFLLGWRGALLFITHDRAFLARLATRIIELDRGRLHDYPGSYAAYLEQQEARLAAEVRVQALADKKLAQEEAWLRQGVKARRTRSMGRVHALLRLRAERAARRERQGSVLLAAEAAELSGKAVITARQVSFHYGGRAVVRDFSCDIQRGDRVGLIGPNGAGKTTLLRLLLGELAPHSGQVVLGSRLEPAYFDQHRAALNEEQTLMQAISPGGDFLSVNGRQRHVLSYLRDFLFSAERARQPVRALSGGERNRLLLARLFTRPSNLLVLDEPTNDLDADTLDLLEDLLAEYSGTILLVSHDRAFLNSLVTSTLVFEGDAAVNEYVGGYDDWLRQRPPAVVPAAAVHSPPSAPATALMPAAPVRPRKLSYKEQREREALPARIEALEAERDALQASMTTPAFYQQGAEAIAAAGARLAALEAELAAAYARWEALEQP
jgi:ATP-binding cassette subfamily F protein uup